MWGQSKLGAKEGQRPIAGQGPSTGNQADVDHGRAVWCLCQAHGYFCLPHFLCMGLGMALSSRLSLSFQGKPGPDPRKLPSSWSTLDEWGVENGGGGSRRKGQDGVWLYSCREPAEDKGTEGE